MSGITISQNYNFDDDYKSSRKNSDILIYPNFSYLDLSTKTLNNTSVIVPNENSYQIYDSTKNKILVQNDMVFNNQKLCLTRSLSNLDGDICIIFDSAEYNFDYDIKNELLKLNYPKTIIYINPLKYENNKIYDGKILIVQNNKIYEFPSFTKGLYHISWRQLSNISNLIYSYTKEGQDYKSQIFKFQHVEPSNSIMLKTKESIFHASILIDNGYSVDYYGDYNNDEVSYFCHQNAISLKSGIVDYQEINFDNIDNMISWRNKLSKLDINGFGLKGVVHPFLCNE